MDKSTTILEAQWMEKEIPRIKDELEALKKLEQELLTTPLDTVSQAYTNTYRQDMERIHPFYHRRRSVVPTRYGYRQRMVDAGWVSVGFQVLIALLTALAIYVVYQNRQPEQLREGFITASILLIVNIVLSFVPMLGALLWERQARRKAEEAAQVARSSVAFVEEKQARQVRLDQCRVRQAELEERLEFAHARYDQLRQELTSGNHQEVIV
jgi:hypothetical protein